MSTGLLKSFASLLQGTLLCSPTREENTVRRYCWKRWKQVAAQGARWRHRCPKEDWRGPSGVEQGTFGKVSACKKDRSGEVRLHKLLNVLPGWGSGLKVICWAGATGGSWECPSHLERCHGSCFPKCPVSGGVLGLPETGVFALTLEER